jgi:hypothetical protein
MNLNYIIMRKMESLFINQDAVLDFKDDISFQEFFKKTVNINISDDEYWHISPSMAKRLKYFWEKESEELVAKVNLELLDLWFYITPDQQKDYEYDIYMDCLKYNQSLLELSNEGNSIQAKSLVKNIGKSSYYVENRFWLFISHKNKDKKIAKALKDNLEKYGISSFVAHEDIHPSSEWVVEIEKALFSMDALIAILTDEFSKSVWTNQEIGVAFGRNVFILSLRMGEDPSGFIGKIQALTPKSRYHKDIADQIALHLINDERTKDKMQKAYFSELSKTGSFADSEQWAQILFDIEACNQENISILIESYNSNSQAKGCFALNGSKYENPKSIADQINEWLGEDKYKIGRYGKIETIK